MFFYSIFLKSSFLSFSFVGRSRRVDFDCTIDCSLKTLNNKTLRTLDTHTQRYLEWKLNFRLCKVPFKIQIIHYTLFKNSSVPQGKWVS